VIALIDYGAGNLTSVRKAAGAAGARVFTPASPDDLAQARGIVLPGVGHFAATAVLDGRWRAAISARIGEGTPFLGICLGMQWLFDGSDEAPDVPGLGYFPGRLARLPRCDANGLRVKVPHVGWNVVAPPPVPARVPRPAGLEAFDGRYAYFTHTFAAPVGPECTGVTVHGIPFAAAVASGPVWGVQFHPEKSGDAGVDLLRAFVTRCGGAARE